MTGAHSRQYGGGSGYGGEELLVHLVGGGPYGMRFDRLGISGPVFVAKMHKRSKAMAAGVQIGDVMLSVNNFDCSHVSPDHVTEFINRSSAMGQPIVLRINRGNPHHHQLLQQHQQLKENSGLDGQSRGFDDFRKLSANSSNGHTSHNQHRYQSQNLQQQQQQPFERYADDHQHPVNTPSYADRSPPQAVRQFSQLSTTVDSTPTIRRRPSQTSYWSDAGHGITRRVWIDDDDDIPDSRQPRQQHVSTVMIPTGEHHTNWSVRGGPGGSGAARPTQPSQTRDFAEEHFDRRQFGASRPSDGPSVDFDRQPHLSGPSPSSSSTLPLRRPRQDPVTCSRPPVSVVPAGSQSTRSPMIWRPLSASTGVSLTAPAINGGSSSNTAASGLIGDQRSLPTFSSADDGDGSVSFAKRFDHSHEFDRLNSHHQQLSTSMIDVNDPRQTAWPPVDIKPLQPDLFRSSQPASSPFSAAVGNNRHSTDENIDDQLDTEVIIWSSKTGDGGAELNRLEPRQRPYSVAAFPINSRRRGDFEETTVTNRAAVSWQPPVSLPVSLPVPPARENRRPVVAASSYDQQCHQQNTSSSGADGLSSMDRGTGFRNDDYSTLSLGRQQPLKAAEQADFSNYFPPSAGRRHSALPAPSSAMIYGNGSSSATTSELFLSRSGIVTGSEHDVIESSTRKKLYGDSSFYEDTEQKYPTIEEQIKLARKVARLLTSSNIVTGRGQQMFMKRQQQSDKWATESTAGQPFYGSSRDQRSRPDTSGSHPPPPPSHVTELAELERLRTHAEKTRHNTLPPVLCNQIADELRRAATKGNSTAGRMFAQRMARADKYVVPEVVVHRRPEPTPPPPIPASVAAMRRSMSQPEVRQQPPPAPPPAQQLPVPRLKQMLEMPRAAMTPWEAASQFDGSVDPAFEHLAAFRQATQVTWTTVDDDDYEENCRVGDEHHQEETDGRGRVDLSASVQHHPTDSEMYWIDQQRQTDWREAEVGRPPPPSRARSACPFDRQPTRLQPSATMTTSAVAASGGGSGSGMGRGSSYGPQQHVMHDVLPTASSGVNVRSTPMVETDWSRATTPANRRSSQLDFASTRPTAAATSGNGYRPMKFRIPA